MHFYSKHTKVIRWAVTGAGFSEKIEITREDTLFSLYFLERELKKKENRSK